VGQTDPLPADWLALTAPRLRDDVYLLFIGHSREGYERRMYGFLLAVLVLDGVFLAVVILLQSGKGGGLAAMGGGAAATEGILGGRQATTVLTRATWTAGGLFMFLSLVLAIMSSRATQPQSILRQDVQPASTTTAPEPLLPGESSGGAETPPTEGAAPTIPPSQPEGAPGGGGEG
jgi:preprotein translocase subunit SecG